MASIKFKITGTKPKTYVGNDVLMLPKGTIVQVVDEKPNASSCIGDLMMRTDEEEYPLVILHSVAIDNHGVNFRGILWTRDILHQYSFKRVEIISLIEE